VLEVAPSISKLPGELRRDRVVKPEEEAKYLAAAPEPLASIVMVLANTGMRPDECYRLRWEDITWANGRYGTVLVRHGKTDAARRVVPLAPQLRSTLELRWEGHGKPGEGWVWPAPTRSGHVQHSSLKKQHASTFRTINAEATKHGMRLLTPWVLYAWRHTFLTRLRRVWLRYVDIGPDCGAFISGNLQPVRTPLRRCCFCSGFAVDRAQF
jgi:integrase